MWAITSKLCIISNHRFDIECWLIVGVVFSWSFLAMLFLPGSWYYGPETATFRPKYRHNAWSFYLLSMLFSVPLIWCFSVLHLYYKFTTFIGILNVCGVTLAVYVYVKAHISPDPGEHDSTGNPFFDFFAGIETYPNLMPNVSLKVLINARISLLLWQLVALVCWKANYELTGGLFDWQMNVVTLLSTVYLAKAFYWEDGYMQSFDSNTERFGFLFAWGCIVFVPSMYNLPNTTLVGNCQQNDGNKIISQFSFVLGLASVVLSYLTDTQRGRVRQSNGQCTVWGCAPKLIRPKYVDALGKKKNTILLASGFWGLARHMNYLFEWTGFLAMVLPTNNLLAYIFITFNLCMPIHRTTRDDKKCSQKYGKYWQEYKTLVQYRIVPGLF